ncbi:hypothetical protein ACJMK2_023148 [Sinanodonta woodiana]|uniref:CUB domain-containing protein n=1 Tax=Sinanodonta woodiana TaxID=1069815 RepID=A0ABD3T3A5_SINWO
MLTVWKYIFCVCYVLEIHGLVVSTAGGIWNSCKATICGRDSGTISCKKSYILITNVTSAQTGTFDAILFSHIRRRCMGLSTCNPASIVCKWKIPEEVNVDYVCVEDQFLERDCWSIGKILDNSKGFIQSPNYPAETKNRTLCKWRLTVPSGYYLRVILHEIEPIGSTSCGGGLLFTTDTKCQGKDIPVSYVCNEKGVDATLTTCGHTEIVMFSSVNLRFWIAYLILPLQDIEPELIYDVDDYCVVHHRPDPTPVPHIGIISSTLVFLENSTNFTSATSDVGFYRPVADNDEDEPYWIYIIIAVCLILLLAVVIIAVCIRYRKRTTTQNKRNTKLMKRPLPEVEDNDKNKKIADVHRPILHETYSHVADEIPYFEDADNTSSPTYAEIEEVSSTPKSCKKTYSAKRKQDDQKSDCKEEPRKASYVSVGATVDSVYAEPDEVKRNSVYAEIEDKKSPKNNKDEQTAKKNRFNLFRNGKKDKEVKNKENIKKKSSVTLKTGTAVQKCDKGRHSNEKSQDVDKTKYDSIQDYSECECRKADDSNTSSDLTRHLKEKHVTDHTYAECADVVIKNDGQSMSRHTSAATDNTDSDSDDVIIMTENEFYEPFEQAKV